MRIFYSRVKLDIEKPRTSNGAIPSGESYLASFGFIYNSVDLTCTQCWR